MFKIASKVARVTKKTTIGINSKSKFACLSRVFFFICNISMAGLFFFVPNALVFYTTAIKLIIARIILAVFAGGYQLGVV